MANPRTKPSDLGEDQNGWGGSSNPCKFKKSIGGGKVELALGSQTLVQQLPHSQKEGGRKRKKSGC